METTNNIRRERRRIKELVREYQNEGFQVYVEPDVDKLPNFLKDYRPDLILKKGDLNVVVEVKTSETIRNATYLKELSAKINSVENWKFELVITNPRDVASFGDVKYKELSLSEIEYRLNYVSNSIDKDFLEPLFIYAWSLFEAASRAILRVEQPKTERRQSPNASIKQLYSYGIIGRIDYEWLSKTYQLRSHLVHGHSLPSNQLKEKDLNKLIRMAEDFLKEIKTLDLSGYDTVLLKLVDKLISGIGDGRLSKADAEILLEAVQDVDSYNEKEKDTIAYISDNYKWTDAADEWFRNEIRKWASSK